MISIIIPLYNKQTTILHTVESALAQTFVDIEVLVIDDGSTDNSIVELSKISDSRLRILPKKNGGVSSARNFGILNAKGDWSLFLDADDILLPNCLEVLYTVAQKFSSNVSSANFYSEYGGRRKLVLHKFWKERLVKNPFWGWATNQFLPRTGATLIKTSLLRNHLFDETLNRSEDAKQIFGLMRENKFVYSPKPVMVYKQDYNDLSLQVSDISKNYIYHLDFSHKSLSERMLYCLMIQYTLQNNAYNRKEMLIKYKDQKILIFFSRIFFGLYNRILNYFERNA